MAAIGRNDPCPCGSGKKYKKCHGAPTASNPEQSYNRIRQLDAQSAELLMKYAREMFGEGVLQEAWEEFWNDEEVPYDENHPEFPYFVRWFHFDWEPLEDETLTEHFLEDPATKIDADLRRLLEETLDAPYSFYQTLDLEPGVFIRLRDILRKREVTIIERTASNILRPGYILFARVVEMDGLSFMMGNGSHVISPRYLESLVDFRTTLERDGDLTGKPKDDFVMWGLGEELRDGYFKIARAEEKRRPDIRNADGDPLEFHTLSYKITLFQKTFDALKGLQLKATGEPEAALFVDNEKDSTGNPVRARIHWMRRKKKDDAGSLSLLATLTVGDATLEVTVNSDKRARRIRKEIERRLGGEAVFIHADVVPAAAMMGKKGKEDAASKGESETQRIFRESPEAKEFLKDMIDKQWRQWPDEPLPALKGMTPRQAARDPIGRELLESVLLDIESRSAAKKDGFLKVDVANLRHTLGINRP